MPDSKINDRDSLSKFIDELHFEYELWYAKSCRLNYRIWYALQLIALLSGFLTSIFVAFQTKEEWSTTIKIICVVVPLIGSLAGTVILQFKIFETWRLREEGRILFQSLVNFAKSEFSKCKEEEDYEKLFEILRVRTEEIEHAQASSFFSLYGSSFIATFSSK